MMPFEERTFLVPNRFMESRGRRPQNNGHDASKVGVGAHEGQYSELIRFGKVMEKHLLASWFFIFFQ